MIIYKFEKLEVWKLAMEFNLLSHKIAEKLPDSEKFNLSSLLRRASTSIALNIAEGSTRQTNAEQKRFLSYVIRSHIEVIACFRLIESRKYLQGSDDFQDYEELGIKLFSKLQSFRKAI